MIKTVVELDLAGYSDIVREIEENLSVEMVEHFNDQIQGFIDEGLAAAKVAREQTVMATTGDGAILIFDRAEQAHHFAEAVHHATWRHNDQKTIASAKRWFRIGAATGDIVIDVKARKMAGITIANAVRLEANATIGCLLIDLTTYDALPLGLKGFYGGVEQVRGKRDEKFWVRRYRVLSESPDQIKPEHSSAEGADSQQTVQQVIASGERSVAIGNTRSINTIITGDGNRNGA